jgi:hypothetical protein
MLYVLSFFKNGTDLTMFVMPQVSYAYLLLQKDYAMLMIICVVVLEGVFASYVVLKLQGMELEKHHSFHP